MSVIRRRHVAPTPPVLPEPRLGAACEHCLRFVGQAWHGGKVRLPAASFVREDGKLETRCPHCERYTTLPYQRVAT
jgi:hypothetical protein